jgi:hypothetical protein
VSADNGWLLRKNSAGKYVLQMYFASDDNDPDVDDPNAWQFDDMIEALQAYEQQERMGASEYGLRVFLFETFHTPSDYLRPVYVERWKEFLSSAGWEAWRTYPNTAKPEIELSPEHKLLWEIFGTQPQKEEVMLETRKYVRKPFEVEAVQVTPENIEAVAAWCGGTVSQEKPDGDRHIEVKVHRPMTPRQSKAFLGDWVLFAGTGYKCYTPRAFEKSFDDLGVTVIHGENDENLTPKATDEVVELMVIPEHVDEVVAVPAVRSTEPSPLNMPPKRNV